MTKITHYLSTLLMLTALLFVSSCKSDKGREVSYIDPGDGKEVLFPAELGSKVVSIKTNVSSLTAKIDNSADAAWLSARVQKGSVTISVTANTERKARSGRVTLSGDGQSATITVTQEGLEPSILISPDINVLSAEAQNLSIRVQANVDYDLPDLSSAPWIKVTSVEKTAKPHTINLQIERNIESKDRSATLVFKTKGTTPMVTSELKIKQEPAQGYSGASGESISGDIKVKVASGHASSHHTGEGIEKSFDGDLKTIYHSNWDNNPADYFPITLDYNFAKAEDIDYLVYYPRNDGGANGNFKQVEILAKDASGNYTKIMDYDFNGVGTASKVEFKNTRKGIYGIRIVVKSGAGDRKGFASCAEMEFYRHNSDDAVPLGIFKDGTASALKPGVTEASILAIKNPLYREIALYLYKNSYPKEFRIQDYRAWPHPDDWTRVSKTGAQNLLDNPTGIVARKGKELIIFVGDTQGYKLNIKVQNLDTPEADGYNNASSFYAISKGVNKITPSNDGLVYILYHTPEYKTAKPIRIHFATGEVNGYYDSQKHKAEDWSRLLGAATYKYFDVLGKGAHLTFTTEGFRKYASTDGPELIAQYDEMTEMMTDFMGLKKYNLPKVNRSYFHAMYTSYMYATTYRTAYNFGIEDVVRTMCDKEQFRRGPWGHAHETGHTLQTAPGFKWVGMIEVTNNVMANLVTIKFGNKSRLMAENRYNDAYNTFFVDRSGVITGWKPRPYIYTTDIYDTVFEKLVPLWQMYLYFTEVKGDKDFYAKLYEKVRKNPDPKSDEECQLEFTRLMCEISGYDLTDFFGSWQFYTPYKGTVKDYSAHNIDLSSRLIQQYKEKITSMGLPKLTADIRYINDDNIDLYRKMASVVPGTFTLGANSATINISNCQNAVAYEALLNGKVIALSTNSVITLPEGISNNAGTVTVNAIAADGKRTALKKA